VGPRNHVLNGGADRQGEKAILGVCSPIEKHWEPLQRKSICWFCRVQNLAGYGAVVSTICKFQFAAVRSEKMAMWPFVRVL